MMLTEIEINENLHLFIMLYFGLMVLCLQLFP